LLCFSTKKQGFSPYKLSSKTFKSEEDNLVNLLTRFLT
jgi:hypothetical protein